MSTTTARQVLYDIASGYKTATGDDTDITYGNITEKVVSSIGGGGIQGGYTVTFKVDGEDYYIASCQQGESITEPPTPTMSGEGFREWRDSNGNAITFPYTPNADIELTAKEWLPAFLAHFDENTNATNNETSINGTVTGTATYADGEFGKALIFDGATSVSYTGDFALNSANSSFTIEFWVKLTANNTSSTQRRIITFFDAQSNDTGTVYVATNQIGLWKSPTAYINYSGTTTQNVWHHIAIVGDNATFKLYRDGTLIQTLTQSGAYSNDSAVTIKFPIETKDRQVDEVAIWNYAKYTANFTPPTQPY